MVDDRAQVGTGRIIDELDLQPQQIAIQQLSNGSEHLRSRPR
ncbi:hypothetical protein [Nocardia beijingensis]